MPRTDATTIELSQSDLREVAGYAAASARPALAIFERERPDDRRPRAAIDAAEARVRAAVPQTRVIYLEPDIDRGPAD